MDTIEHLQRVIKSQQGVPYLKGFPGMGKTAIPEYIAKTLNGWDYIDYRASNKDSAEIIGMPAKFALLKNGREVPVEFISPLNIQLEDIETFFMRYIPPSWAVKANLSKKPVLVSFEEINRAPIEVINALLQILLERRVGEDFKINDNVYFVATGNLGEEDDCDVNELDRATLGRFYVIKWNPSIDEWIKYFAKDNVNLIITAFVKAYPEYAYKVFQTDGGKDSSNSQTMDAYCCYRSLTFLSNFVGKDEKNYGKIISDVEEFGKGYIGLAYRKLVQFIQETQRITVQDILDRYQEVKEIIKQRPRDINNELLTNLEKVNYPKLKANQMDNVIEFLKTVDDDLRVGFFNYLFSESSLVNIEFEEENENVDDSKSKLVYKNQTIKKFLLKLWSVFPDELKVLNTEEVIR